jgi:hypothetical protein
MSNGKLMVRHVYTHDGDKLERDLNVALREITSSGGVVMDIKYAIDPSTHENRRGGYGTLIVYERGSGVATLPGPAGE